MGHQSKLVVIALLLGRIALAQTPQPAASALGVFRGTSLCLVRPSACHDELVIYRITPAKTADSVSLDALKIVNGEEQDMGTLACHVVPPGPQLFCAIPRATWRFAIRGDSLTGDLTRADGTKFRDVRAARSR